ncbi:MAG: hypothetical protein WCO04_18225, partial [Pseudomonadota bacterium]
IGLLTSLFVHFGIGYQICRECFLACAGTGLATDHQQTSRKTDHSSLSIFQHSALSVAEVSYHPKSPCIVIGNIQSG